MRLKKILMLGGSAQQIVAIETAKRLGYYTVVCDYLTDNPGQYVCDKFYLVSTTDKEAVLEVAKAENIDGVIAYASDPAAPTAAYVAEKLGLPTNPYSAVDILCNKDKFRAFLAENGFDCPDAKSYTCEADALADKENFDYPIIMKPVDSSGSKGVTILKDSAGYEDAVKFAFSFSRAKKIIAEKFIVNKYSTNIGGDIFINDGKVIIWGLMNCFRGHSPNPLVPGGEVFPAKLTDEEMQKAKDTLQNMVTKLGLVSGCVNVELMLDNDGRVYLIDIGPRAGGNMIPIQLSAIFGVDIVEMSVLAAMGEKLDVKPEIVIPYCAHYVLHSDRDGIYRGIEFAEEIEGNIFRKALYKNDGDTVERFDNAAKALGIIFLRFDSEKEMYDKMDRMNEYIKVVLD